MSNVCVAYNALGTFYACSKSVSLDDKEREGQVQLLSCMNKHQIRDCGVVVNESLPLGLTALGLHITCTRWTSSPVQY